MGRPQEIQHKKECIVMETVKASERRGVYCEISSFRHRAAREKRGKTPTRSSSQRRWSSSTSIRQRTSRSASSRNRRPPRCVVSARSFRRLSDRVSPNTFPSSALGKRKLSCRTRPRHEQHRAQGGIQFAHALQLDNEARFLRITGRISIEEERGQMHTAAYPVT